MHPAYARACDFDSTGDCSNERRRRWTIVLCASRKDLTGVTTPVKRVNLWSLETKEASRLVQQREISDSLIWVLTAEVRRLRH